MTWTTFAACRGADLELFYGTPNETHEDRLLREADALALCRSCSVRYECRAAARRNNEFGIWGQETELQREAAGFPPRITRGIRLERLEMADA